ncbi:MAG: sodium:dicarboxylate symporter [Elusimicrobia bacterium GWA2_69_24]|nr:MAG: sodium:dicarboxylate symporter [Elusimicrobia bacterium GWA2_69_24]HBL17768.1 dicarboxylate/amino acid:cation symporter [Elusimicrobiota bacterium]
MTLKKTPQHVRIFAGLAAGAGLGLAARALWGGSPGLAWAVANVAQPMGQVFLRVVFMAVVPLVVAALVLGVTEIGEAGKVGRIGLRTLILTLVLSSIAVLIGVFAVNWVRPGVGLPEESRQRLIASFQGQGSVQASLDNAAKAKPAVQSLLELIPKNPIAEAVNAFEGGLIPLMVFSLVLGLALSLIPEEKSRPLKELLGSVLAAMLKVIDFAMWLAPFGVGGLIFSVTAMAGLEVLGLLAKYFFLVIGALAFHLLVVYSAAVWFLARRSPLRFFRDISGVLVTAFATSSSSATLPVTLKASEENLKIPRPIGNFVLTIGATANQNGTALYEGITVLFLAQFFGVPLTLSQQALVVVWSVMAGVGTAGVPGGSLPLIVIVLQSIGVPGEAIGIILGVDRILDMSRTVLNVAGDLTIAACVAEWEKKG